MRRNTLQGYMLCAAMVWSAACSQAQTWNLVDASGVSGLTGGHNSLGIVNMEFMTAGGAVGDFNNDGSQDVFMLGGVGGPDQLYINDGTGNFTEASAAWGVDLIHRGSGAAVGDYNNDGWLDIYVTSFGPLAGAAPGHMLLYKNNGDGTFTDVAAAAGVQWTSPTETDAFGAAFGDYDLDGDLDLAVAGWNGTFSQGNVLFQNNGDETFTNVTATAILADMTTARGFAPRFTDTNGDRYPELLWVSDFYTSLFLINNGDGTFSDGTAAAGVGLDSNGMGTTTGDFNNDGLIDWYVSSRIDIDTGSGSGNMLYINQNGTVFSETSVAAGVNDGGWGWGAVAADLDNDGDLDITSTNGFAMPNFQTDQTRLWSNNNDGTFALVSDQVGCLHTGQGRGLINFDADNDGDQDLLILSNSEPMTYYRNDLTLTNANWLRLGFDTSTDSRLAPNGFGTHVSITAGGLTQVRYLDGGCNYLSQSELLVHFGVGSAAMIDTLAVTWASGQTLTLQNVSSNQLLTITACPADFTGEGVVDVLDFFAFIVAFNAQDPLADLNADQVVDVLDFFSFVGAFSLGCN